MKTIPGLPLNKLMALPTRGQFGRAREDGKRKWQVTKNVVKRALAGVIGFAMTLTAISCTESVRHQGVLGDWQGTIADDFGKSRLILRIAEGKDNNLKATLFTIDQNPDWGFGLPATVILEKSSIKLSVDDIGGRYDGKFNPDKVSIDGTWVQGRSQSLRFQRPTAETIWRDTSPHKIQFIPIDTNVSLEVLDWGGSGRPRVWHYSPRIRRLQRP
jgi:hypothetical protein